MSRRKSTPLQAKSMSNISSLRAATKEKTTQEIKSLMNNRHQAVYHKSAFTVSDLNNTSDAIASTTDSCTMCRICQSTDDSLDNQQVTPCSCSGSLQYVHMQCLQQWRQTKKITGADVSACELCKQPYNVQLLGSTDVPEDRIMKMQEDLKQLVKSGIYLMLLMRSWKSDLQNAQISSSQQLSHQPQLSSTHRRVSQRQPLSVRSVSQQQPQHRTLRLLETGSSSSDDNDEYVSRRSLKDRDARNKRRQRKNHQ